MFRLGFLLLLLRLLYHILFYSMLPIPILGSTFCLFTRTHMHPHIHSLSYLPTRVNISCKCAINKNRRNKPKKCVKSTTHAIIGGNNNYTFQFTPPKHAHISHTYTHTHARKTRICYHHSIRFWTLYSVYEYIAEYRTISYWY